MDRHIIKRLSAVAMAAGVAGALTLPSSVAANSPVIASDTDGSTSTAPAGEAASSEMLAAMQRDFDLTADQARDRLVREDVAMRTAGKLEEQLGSSFAGSWLDDHQRLVVAVTDDRDAAKVRALGAQPSVVDHNQAQLDRTKAALDRSATPDAAEVTGWYVDTVDNTVVVQAAPGARAAAEAFVRTSGVNPSEVQVEVTEETPRLLYDVRGGDAYYPGGSRCSVGFSVNGGFVTAGHCGGSGTSTAGYNQVNQGVVQDASFPGDDYGYVSVNSDWTPTPLVNRYSGDQTVTVEGGQEAPINASVCRSGSTTGWHCGEIQAKNQTVNYQQGSVHGLTRTNVCAEPGDSGGSFISGQQAQGVTSGGSGNCSVGGTTYFQPVQEILQEYGLTLVTGDGGGDPPPPPPPPPGGCEDYTNQYSGSLSGSGDYDYQPNGSYFYWGAYGLHEGCLSGPDSADFDLYLQRFYSGWGWLTVAASTSPDSEEELTYNGSPGYYRYVVNSYSGSGGYDVGIDVP